MRVTPLSPDLSTLPEAVRPTLVGDLPHLCAEAFGDRVAFIAEDRETSFRAWNEGTERVSQALLAQGIGADARVALLAVNDVPFFDGYAGIARAGGIAVPLSTRLSTEEIAFILRHSEARWLLTDAPSRESASAAAAAVPGTQLLDLADLPVARAEVAAPHRDPSDLAAIFYTSGSTADPKGVSLTHGNVLACVESCATAFRITQDDVALGVLPMYHTSVHFIPLPTLTRGGTVVLREGFSASSTFELMERHGVTLLPTVTSIAVLMAKHHHASGGGFDVSALRKILLGGSGVPTSLLETWREFAPQAVPVNCYGMTEMSPAISRMDPGEFPERPGSVGLPYPGNEIRIERADGEWAAPGEVGEILVRGPARMAGYWRNEEATEQAIRDGWLATGDLGTLDGDGYLTIVGRKKWMLKRGGENVFPDEVEAALINHDAISEVVVVGVPDDVMGERIAAIVVTQPGAALEPDELRTWALGRLAAFKVPDLYVVTTKALPKNGVGKVDVARLKSDARDGHIAWVDVRQRA